MPWVAARVVEVAQSVTDAEAQVTLATTQAGNADTSAIAAAASAATAGESVGEWVSEATYAAGPLVFSPIDFKTYRSKTAHTGVATDPSADATNWLVITARALTSQATAEAGTNNTESMSPLRTAQSIAALAPNAANYQEFLTSGTWAKPAGVTFVYVEAIAAGGGGANHTTSTNVGAASGGEYVASIFEASSLSATETITIGAAGAGAADGAVADGSVGGDSSFGSLLTAIGGNPGVTGPSYSTIPRSGLAETADTALSSIAFAQAGYGGQGSTSGVGGNTIYGGAGGGGASASTSSAGGTSEFGGNGGAGNTVSDTKAGNGSVPGGGGGGSSDDGGGGDGGAGRIRVWSW
tara:strand:+ start:167 stop:1222 length:1056 start_codon:yes stop_codon:yes gene_type:complete